MKYGLAESGMFVQKTAIADVALLSCLWCVYIILYIDKINTASYSVVAANTQDCLLSINDFFISEGTVATYILQARWTTS